MPKAISHKLSFAAQQMLREIDERDIYFRGNQICWITSCFEETAKFPLKLATELYLLVSEIARCIEHIFKDIHNTAKKTVLEEMEMQDLFYQAFVTRPVRLIASPIRLVWEPLFARISLYLDTKNYITTAEEGIRLDDLEKPLEEANCIAKTIQASKDLWPREGLVLTDFGREFHIFFNGDASSAKSINRFLYSLDKEYALQDPPSAQERNHFLSTICNLEHNQISTIVNSFSTCQNEAICRVKYALIYNFLTEKGIAPKDAVIIALKAMAFSTQYMWATVAQKSQEYAIDLRFYRNNLVITQDKQVFLDLCFANYRPAHGDWTVRRAIPDGKSALEGKLRIDIGSAEIQPMCGTVSIEGLNEKTIYIPNLIRNSIYVNALGGSYIMPCDTAPTF
jgi:hypothetical protein